MRSPEDDHLAEIIEAELAENFDSVRLDERAIATEQITKAQNEMKQQFDRKR